jgi:hypothetical protein
VGLIQGSEKPKGAARLATLALGVSSIPNRTIERKGSVSAATPEELREALTIKPTKAAQKRVQKKRRTRKK